MLLVSALGNWALGSVIIKNGEFSVPGTPPDPFDGWTTAFGDPPTDGGGFALFRVVDPLDAQQLEQQFLLPADALTLAFDVRISTIADGTDLSSAPDSFQATLYNAIFDPLFPSGDPLLFPGYYSLDNSGLEFFDSMFVSVQDLAGGVKQVTLDVSSLASQRLWLDFSLFGSDDGLATEAWVDNVFLTQASQSVVPEPATLAIWAVFALVGVPASWRVGARRRNSHSPDRTTASRLS
jgi:hypothetical protein